MSNEMQEGVDHTIQPDRRRDLILAINEHISLSELSGMGMDIDQMRRNDAMARMVGLLETRGDLDELIKANPKE